jgi:hypothetical protein
MAANFRQREERIEFEEKEILKAKDIEIYDIKAQTD